MKGIMRKINNIFKTEDKKSEATFKILGRENDLGEKVYYTEDSIYYNEVKESYNAIILRSEETAKEQGFRKSNI